MEYIGIRASREKETKRFLQQADDRGDEVCSLSREHPVGAVAWKGDDTTLQIKAGEGGLCVIDGRIRGVEALRKKYGMSASSGDADVLRKAWLHHGEAVIDALQITASITLWNTESERLCLVRAHNGIPPIFFARRQGALLWSNSMKMLLQYGVDATLDDRALDAYFAMGYVPSPWTLLKGIRKVPAGQYLESGRGHPTFKRHWQPIRQSQRISDLDRAAEVFKRKLCRSLERLVAGHDRVGVLLSSGVDSSLLVGLLHRELQVPVEAFTFHYSDYEGQYNEYARARLLTRRYGIPHHKIPYSADWLRSNLPEAVKRYEEPFTYGHHTARLDAVAQRRMPLLLNGILPESEFISRTANYALRVESSMVREAARRAGSFLDSWPFNTLSRLAHAVRIIASPSEELFYNLSVNSVLSDSTRKRLYRNEDRCRAGREEMLRLFRNVTEQSGLARKAERLSHLKNSLFVPDHLLWWNYRWAHAHELEMAPPYLTPRMRSWMESLQQPLWPSYRESIRKVLIRRAAETVMPKEIAHHRKIAQSAPFWVWLQGPLRSMLHKYLHPARLHEDELFDVEFVQQAVRDHVAGRKSHPYLLWTLLCFMVWKEEVLH